MTDQGSDGIEITPEMIEAGVNLLMDFEWGWGNPQDYVTKIFRSMCLAAPQADVAAARPVD